MILDCLDLVILILQILYTNDYNLYMLTHIKQFLKVCNLNSKIKIVYFFLHYAFNKGYINLSVKDRNKEKPLKE